VNKLLSKFAFSWLMLVIALPLLAQEDEIERPKTEELLPETTALFVQVEDIYDFIEKAKETGVGQVFQTPEIAGLVEGMYGEAEKAYDQVKDSVGLELDDIRNFPNGEMTFAIVAPKRADLQFALMVEIDEESDAVQNIFARGEEFLLEQGEEMEVDDRGDIEFQSFTADGQRITMFIKDGLMVTSNSAELSQQMVDRWMGRTVDKIRPLTENRKFVTVMNRCRGTKETPPETRFYIDPISIARGATRGNVGAQAVINFLPLFGLDGLSAIGGSTIYDELGFESVAHVHVMLANPRAGLFKMLALKPGDYEPESWVPEDVNNYVSTSWDFQQTIAEIGKIVDTFQGDGAFQTEIEENVNEEIGMDFQEDILTLLTGRVSYMTLVDLPATFNSQYQVVAIELTDLDKFEEFREKVFARFEEDGDLEDIEKIEYKGVPYWAEAEENRIGRSERIRERIAERGGQNGSENVFDPEAAQSQPCVGVIGNSLIIASHPKFLEKAIDTERGELPSLVDEEEFAETTETLVKLLRNDMPSAVFFQRPAAGFEMMFDLAGGEQVQGLMDLIDSDEDEPNEFIGGFRRVMEENPLPEFDEVRSYFAPSGGFITDDDTGYHMMFFQMKYDR
jgi:hypothetical protein